MSETGVPIPTQPTPADPAEYLPAPPAVTGVTVITADGTTSGATVTGDTIQLPRVEGYIVFAGGHYWGWGATLEDAKRACRKAGYNQVSVARGKRAVYRLPLGAINARVDDMGGIHWDWADHVPSLEDADDRRRKGEWIEEPTR